MGNKNKKNKNSQKPNMNKVKKDKGVFKVAAQNQIKKAKQVKNNVKNIKKKPNQDKNEKLNKQLSNLHQDLVKVNKPAIAKPQQPNKKQKQQKKAVKTKEVVADLAKMDV